MDRIGNLFAYADDYQEQKILDNYAIQLLKLYLICNDENQSMRKPKKCTQQEKHLCTYHLYIGLFA